MTYSPMLTETEYQEKKKQFAIRFGERINSDDKFRKSFIRLLRKDEELENLWVSIRNAVVFPDGFRDK